MGKGIPGLETAYHTFFTAVLIFLAVMVVLCLIRAIIGPRIADRIVSVNMMGTMVMVIIAILALELEEGYLVDICLIYAMLSFLAVIVLTKVYMGVYLQKKKEEEAKKKEEKAKKYDEPPPLISSKPSSISVATSLKSASEASCFTSFMMPLVRSC